MQVAIDNAKRAFDIDLTKEIDLIKKDMNIEENGLPLFWQITKKDKRKCKSEDEKKKRLKANKEKIKAKLNEKLICPMNYLYGLQLTKFRSADSTLPMSEFMNKDIKITRSKTSRRIEDMIEEFSLELNEFSVDHKDENWKEDKEAYFLLRADFDNLINKIRKIGISKNYTDLMMWLINRAFKISPKLRDNMKSTTDKNKSILIKVLYEVNPKCFLQCFIEKNGTAK